MTEVIKDGDTTPTLRLLRISLERTYIRIKLQMTCDEVPQIISKALWALGAGRRVITVEMIREGSRQEARNRCSINILKLASSFFWFQKVGFLTSRGWLQYSGY